MFVMIELLLLVVVVSMMFSNLGGWLIYGQVCIYCWMQENGIDVMMLIDVFVVLLLLLQIDVNVEQLIWFVCMSCGLLVVEESYCVLIDELFVLGMLVDNGVMIWLCYFVFVFIEFDVV